MKAFLSQEGKAAVLAYTGQLMKKLEIPHEERMIPTRYGDTFVLSAGDPSAPPVVLLHGSSMNASMWVSDVETLSQHFRVCAPDLPGEPGRSEENQLPFDTQDYFLWLADLLDALSLEKASLVGASLGGWLAAGFSGVFPQRVEKLALLCPAGIGSQNEEFPAIAASLLSKGETGVDELFTLINGGSQIPEVFLSFQKLIAVSFNARKEPIPRFADEELRKLTMPLAVFLGEKDILLRSDETAARVREVLPHAKIVLLADKGHSLTGLSGQMEVFLRGEQVFAP